MADVEMKLAEVKSKEEKKEEEETAPAPPPLTPVAEIKANSQLIERAVKTLEPRFTHRALRPLNSLRKKLDDAVLRDAVEEIYPKGM